MIQSLYGQVNQEAHMAGQRYQLKDVEAWKVKLKGGGLRGQTSLILKALIDAHPSGLTIAEVSELVKDEMVTRQPVDRVVGFYFSTWKKAGHLVSTIGTTTPPAAEGDRVREVVDRPVRTFTPVESEDEAEEEEDEDEEEEDEEDEDNGEVEEAEENELQNTLAKTEKMKDAILAIIAAVPNVAGEEIINTLQEHWRTGTTRKSINDCLHRMTRADEIRRQEQGGYLLPEMVS